MLEQNPASTGYRWVRRLLFAGVLSAIYLPASGQPSDLNFQSKRQERNELLATGEAIQTLISPGVSERPRESRATAKIDSAWSTDSSIQATANFESIPLGPLRLDRQTAFDKPPLVTREPRVREAPRATFPLESIPWTPQGQAIPASLTTPAPYDVWNAPTEVMALEPLTQATSTTPTCDLDNRLCANPGMRCCSGVRADGCCDGLCCCNSCRSPLWFRAEALLWFMQGYETPALATTSADGTPPDSVGVLGLPTTSTLFGNDTIGDGLRIGGRLTGGWWFDDCRRLGIQAELLAIGNDDSGASFPRMDGQTVARPFFNTDPAALGQDSQILNLAGVASGTLNFGTSSRIYSAAPSLRKNLLCCQNTDGCSESSSWRMDGVLGYRYFGVNEAFNAREVLNPEGGLWPAGTRYELTDMIETKNDFHGVEFGAIWMYQRKRWLLEVTSLLAIGEIHRTVARNGSTRITVPGAIDETRAGGFLVRPEDIGTISDRDYAVLPQARVNVGYCIGNNWRATIGYNFMSLSSLFRPGAYMNNVFDGSTLAHEPQVGAVADSTRFKESVWLHGLSFGLAYQF